MCTPARDWQLYAGINSAGAHSPGRAGHHIQLGRTTMSLEGVLPTVESVQGYLRQCSMESGSGCTDKRWKRLLSVSEQLSAS